MKDEYIRRWVQKAENDLKSVSHELDLPPEEIVTDVACYHCQQAAEKYLKAFLTAHDRTFPKTHNIERLVAMCLEFDPDLAKLETGELTDYASDIRYPDDFYEPTVSELKEAYRIALGVRAVVRHKLGLPDQGS